MYKYRSPRCRLLFPVTAAVTVVKAYVTAVKAAVTRAAAVTVVTAVTIIQPTRYRLVP